jgi:poly-gamma-glutamate capsule biosynthesis protein CapA/YwtB (metallophosphatase superfamily)
MPVMTHIAAAALATAAVELAAFGDFGFVGGNAAFRVPAEIQVTSRLDPIKPLKARDLNFLNVEGSVTRLCKRFAVKEYAFAIAPAALTAYAKWGFNLMSLANNHSLDCVSPPQRHEIGKALAVVRRAAPGVVLHGVAASEADLLKHLAIKTVNGVRVGMVAIKAWEGDGSTYIGNPKNQHKLFAALQKAAVDVRILSLHGGTESVRNPDTNIIETARSFVAQYDGDLVLGHHPHKAQGFEFFTKKNGRTAAIFYSLGNGLHNGLSEAGDGMVARMKLTKQGVDPTSLAVFPLADAATALQPIRAGLLGRYVQIFRSSSNGLTKSAAPPGLKARPFKMYRTLTPAPGLALRLP